MKLKDFVGNYNEVKHLLNWLDDFYSGIKDSNYVILVGAPGNGKTLLAELLAKELKAELFVISPFTVSSREYMDDVIKSINIASLTHDRKLILIDDIDEFHFSYKKSLYSIPELSRFPIIFTSKKYKLPVELTSGVEKSSKGKWFHKIDKPLKHELKELILKQEICKLTSEEAYTLAEQSKSVRSALLALKTGCVNMLLDKEQSRWDIISSIRNRKLTVPLDRKNIRWIFKSIRGCNPKVNGTMDEFVAVIDKFAEFDYRIHVKHETIDPFFVNEMEEPLEKVNWKYVHENPKSKYRKKKAYVKKEKVKVVVKKKSPLDDWM